MRSSLLRSAALGVAAVLALGATACGGGSARATTVRTLDPPGLGDQVLDLAVEPETAKVSALRAVKRPYVDGVGLFSLRRDTQLEATLQISRFNKDAKTGSARFRDSVVRQIGSTTPHEFRLGDDRVWLTTGRRQSVSVWFKDRYLFVLSVRDEYAQPRALLRSVLQVEP
ncbi:MAG TPA: hypothetical protein VMZ22_09975 [Acidimicrobiales bacterium]|nr:hypothetical protein [Acidimicrobiales bacterium]